MNYITGKVKQYENLDNYYCHIREYGDNDIIENREIWYKDGVYKIKSNVEEGKTSKLGNKIIDNNEEKRYEIINNNIQEFNWENNDEYENGRHLYYTFPNILKNTTLVNIIDSILPDIIYMYKNEEKIFFKYNNCVIQLSKDFLPTQISYTISNKSESNGYFQNIKYYEIKLNVVEEKDVSMKN